MKRILHVLIVILVVSFTAKKFNFKKANLLYIPAGTFYLNDDTISVMTMYMSSTEVTNKEYRLFLNDLNKQGRTEDFKIAMVDSLLWNELYPNKSGSRHYLKHYFNHPAFSDYPVVNISKEGAQLYCEWYTKQMLIKYPESNFNDFRLPTKLEWVYAAKGGLRTSPYPWGGPEVTDQEGNHLANYYEVGDHNIRKDESGNMEVVKPSDFLFTNEYTNNVFTLTLVESVKAFNPNGYGLYNMAGNVNEMVLDENVVMGGDWESVGYDIRVTSEKKYEKANPLTGFRIVSTYPLTKIINN
jgi:formylglycine-generating enzyme required for sulfatase activity